MTSRESWFECRFVSEEGEWVGFVRGWDAAMAEAAFRDELGTIAAGERGSIRVVAHGTDHEQISAGSPDGTPHYG
jgi:hypothetical protein